LRLNGVAFGFHVVATLFHRRIHQRAEWKWRENELAKVIVLLCRDASRTIAIISNKNPYNKGDGVAARAHITRRPIRQNETELDVTAVVTPCELTETKVYVNRELCFPRSGVSVIRPIVHQYLHRSLRRTV